jgi:uncharacterized membrane protein
MTNLFGMNFPTPDITGLLSQSWIYVAIILVVTIIAGTILAIVLFFMTYSYKVEVYANIGGGKQMVRIIKTRARRVKVGAGGEELFKLLRPRVYRTAYGKRISPKTYAFAEGQDGYWYNITLGDLDTQLGILDVEPVERDMRMMQVAVEKIIQDNYNPNKTAQMVMMIGMFVVVLIFLVGMYVIVGKFSGISTSLQEAGTKFENVASVQAETTKLMISSGIAKVTPSGLVPAGLMSG